LLILFILSKRAERLQDFFSLIMNKNIVILATLDTKGEEVAHVKGLLEARGDLATLVDVAPLGPPAVEPDYANEAVAKLGGWDLADLLKKGERDEIMAVMGKGAAKLVLGLFKEGSVDGVMGLGGNQGSAIASMAMKVLPIGFPKFLVSTVASGNIRPYVGHKDIAVMFSVGDMLGGPNAVTGSILANATAALMGMVEYGEPVSTSADRPTIAISELGNTEKAARHAVELLREKGFHVVPFHASGAGGSAMEELIETGAIHGVLDLTPHELAEEVIGVGAYVPVKPGRLSAAGRAGIPQVVSTGGLEYLCFGPFESIPTRLRRRRIYMHNPLNANLKISRVEMAGVGRIMANRLNEAKGPTAVIVPLKGWSIYGSKGGPLYDPQGNRGLVQELKENLSPEIELKTLDAHINDNDFVEQCVDKLVGFMEKGKKSEPEDPALVHP
jgi:uncharacterized protein (UPF0261 family)